MMLTIRCYGSFYIEHSASLIIQSFQFYLSSCDTLTFAGATYHTQFKEWRKGEKWMDANLALKFENSVSRQSLTVSGFCTEVTPDEAIAKLHGADDPGMLDPQLGGERLSGDCAARYSTSLSLSLWAPVPLFCSLG